ncbi:MAG: STAS domain-containing protein [Leptospiraceae bacterium]
MWAEVEKKEQGNCVLLRFRGHWELERHYELRSLFLELLDLDQPRIIMNLSEVDHFSSSIMGAIIGFQQDLTRIGGRMILVDPSETVQLTIRLLRLENFFAIGDSELAASEKLGCTSAP